MSKQPITKTDFTPAPDLTQGSPERFGYSWEKFSELTPAQHEQFKRWTAALGGTESWQGKRFLDVGCGAGRNSYWAMQAGALGGTAIDIDPRSLAAAQKNLASYPQVEVAFRSVYELQPQPVFDIVFSIGVIHHLEAPQQAIRQMASVTLPGGKVLIWVYGYENMGFFVHLLNPMRRFFFSKLPIRVLRWLAFIPTALLWIGLRLGFGKIEYFQLLRQFPFMHLHHIIFDQMLPRIAHYWRRDTVQQLLEQAGLEDIHLVWVNEMSWSAVGTRPPSAVEGL